MNHYCCVAQCSSWVKRNHELSFHTFPKPGKSKVFMETKLGNKVLVDRREMWIKVLKIKKKVSDNMRVCSLHFSESDFLQKQRIKRRTLKLNSIPSKKLPLVSTQKASRDSRTTLRKRPTSASNAGSNIIEIEICKESEPCENVPELEDQQDREAAKTLLALVNPQQKAEEPQAGPSSRDISVQVDTPEVLTLCELITTDEQLRNLTGVDNFAIFDSVVEILERYHKNKRTRLSIRQQVMLLLTKFKTCLNYVTLSSLFGITPDLTETYIHEIIPVMAKILKPLIYFPSKSEILRNMPISFEDFQNVRIVLDCTEILVQSPKCLCCRIRFYSRYKSHTTVKFMTGVSPGGLITYISKAYGGGASDEVIFEQSNIISCLDAKHDAVMVDKDFRIEDIYKIKLIRPLILEKEAELSAEECILNAKIASARVHIERLNQRLKIFKILSGKLNWALVPMIDNIFIIICAITNLSAPILADSNFLSN